MIKLLFVVNFRGLIVFCLFFVIKSKTNSKKKTHRQ